MFPNLGTKASTTPKAKQVVDALTFHGRASSRRGCLGHTEFSTVSETVDSGGGLGRIHRRKAVAPDVNTQALGMHTAAAPTEGDLEQERLSPSLARVQEHTTRVLTSGRQPRPFRGPDGQDTQRDKGHPTAAPADLQPSIRLQVF